jgi:hypothetical protein
MVSDFIKKVLLGTRKVLKATSSIFLKVASFILSIFCFVVGIIIWFSIGKESFLISVLEIPLGCLFCYIGWRFLRRVFTGGNNFAVGSTQAESNEGWHSNDYH